MIRFICINGPEEGETALGKWMDTNFYIKVDRFEHPWSHGWHQVNPLDWKVIE